MNRLCGNCKHWIQQDPWGWGSCPFTPSRVSYLDKCIHWLHRCDNDIPTENGENNATYSDEQH